MPIQNRPYPQSVVRPYLFGLLPDSEEQRKAIARSYDGRPYNPVTILEHIGLDCPGAIQFCPANYDVLVDAISASGEYVPLDDHDVSCRMKALADDRGDSWHAGGEHWSLGGTQGKFALAWHGGRWCSCQGSAATTHIFKNGVAGYRLQALNEYVCMKLAVRCRLRTAEVDYRLFEDEPALVVRRFDRVEEDVKTIRLHHGDLCQSLSVMPDMKYTSDGGPSTYDVLRLLSATGAQAHANLRVFTSYIFFNSLIGAPDAHAKNYSLVLSEGEMRDSLVYDAGDAGKSRFVQEGRLNMHAVLEGFRVTWEEVFGPLNKEGSFDEFDGRRQFLLYLKPIINGTGNCYIEAQTRDQTRTDVIVDYAGEQFVVELKIWRGPRYNEEGEAQLRGYLEHFGLDVGYMLSFNFNKRKEPGFKRVNVGNKVLWEEVL